MNRSVWAISICVLATLPVCGPSAGAANRVGMIVDTTPGQPAVYGLETLEEALSRKGYTVQRLDRVAAAEADFLILAGLTSGDGAGPRTLRTLNIPLPEGSEGLVIQRAELEGKSALILCGSDARGLMYAALDAADRISWNEKAGAPFSHVRDTREKPYVRERAVSIYTMQRAYFERRLYDEKHWQKYFGMLARSRINSFVVVFGYENGGFMAPPYPYFFNMPEFPEVRLVGTTAEQQEHNTAAFRRMIEVAPLMSRRPFGITSTAGGSRAEGLKGPPIRPADRPKVSSGVSRLRTWRPTTRQRCEDSSKSFPRSMPSSSGCTGSRD